MTWFIRHQQTADWSAETGYIPIRESGRALLESEGFYKEHPEFEVAVKQMSICPRGTPAAAMGRCLEDYRAAQ